MKIKFHMEPGSEIKISAGLNNQPMISETVDKWAVAHRSLKLMAGRIAIAKEPLAIAHSRPRADGKYTLSLGDLPAGSSIQKDGNVVTELEIIPQKQLRGWDAGEYYHLRTDANDDLVIYPGQRHRKVYLTRGPNAWGKPEIAAHAGVAEATVTTNWLIARPQYGGSEDMPLTFELAQAIFNATMNMNSESRSDWYLFERGYEYPSIIMGLYCRGEDELHPMVFTGWGEDKSWFTVPGMNIHSYGPQNVIIHDAHFVGRHVVRYGYCTLVDRIKAVGDMESDLGTIKYCTLRRARFKDNFKLVPNKPIDGEKWSAMDNRHQALYSSGGRGFRIEKSFFDHAGWAEGYDPYLDADKPHPPSMYSHNLYIAHSTYDVTLLLNIFMRGASFGAQVRASGQEQFNVFIDNNIAFNSLGGNYEFRGPVGAYNLGLGNVVYMNGYKRVYSTTTSLGKPVSAQAGAYNWGIEEKSLDGSLIATVIAHLANPDDPADIARKDNLPSANSTLSSRDRKFYNDTKIFKWSAEGDENVEGLDNTTLMQTTVQRYMAERLGQPTATLDDAAAFFMDPNIDLGLEIEKLNAYFLNRFGFSEWAQDRTEAEECVFLPDPRGEGYRWDNPINWSNKDLPGRNPADTVVLGGARTVLGAPTSEIASLRFDGGLLEVAAGALICPTFLDAADIKIRRAGQIITDTIPDGSKIQMDGGMLLCRESLRGDLHLGGTSAAVLPTQAILNNVTILGERARLGWDGTGVAGLTINGTLTMKSGVLLSVNNLTTETNEALKGAKALYLVPGLRLEAAGWQATVSSLEMMNTYKENGSRVWAYDLEGMPAEEVFVYARDLDFIGYDRQPEIVDPPVPVELSTRFIPLSYAMPSIRPFRSGMLGDGVTAPTIQPQVTLACGLSLDLRGMGAGSYKLIEGAQISGSFDHIDVFNLNGDLNYAVQIKANEVVLTLTAK